MVPPIKPGYGNEININTPKQADNVVADLTEKEDKLLFDALSKKISTKESKESKETTEKKEDIHKYLFNQLHMTTKDKENMEKSIKFLADKKMDTLENLKKLKAIKYEVNYIEIGDVKRSREDLEAKPNNKTIYQYGGVTYFKGTQKIINYCEKILAKKNMQIPMKIHYSSSLQALPGYYSNWKSYMGGNILAFILDISKSGFYSNDGKLYTKNEYGHRRTVSCNDGDPFREEYSFDNDIGGQELFSKEYAVPIRPIFK